MPIFYSEHVYQPGNVDAGHIPIETSLEKRYPSHAGGLVIEGEAGGKTIDELKPQKGEYLVLKNRPSSFFGTRLRTFLQAEGVETILAIGGVCLAVCGMATIIDAMQHNYRVIGVRDCLVANDHDPDEIMHEQMLRSIAMNFGYLVDSHTLVAAVGGGDR
jgi:ureidoacrylate peracid hydrolase